MLLLLNQGLALVILIVVRRYIVVDRRYKIVPLLHGLWLRLCLYSLRSAPGRLRKDLPPPHLLFFLRDFRPQLRLLLLPLLSFPSLMSPSLLFHLLLTEHAQRLTDLDGAINVPLIVETGVENDGSHIVHSGEQPESGYETHQLVVVRIIVPAQDRDAVLGLELVAVR